MILAFSLSDIIRVPFGYLLDWLYQFTNSYGLALVLFALAVKVILLPVSAKSKKSIMAMSRLAPLAQAIQKKYPNDPQKAQLEVSKLYKEEGVSMFGGCLWGFVPLLFLFPLYYVIREPLTYMLHFSAEESASIVAAMKELAPTLFGSNTFYDQLTAAAHLNEYGTQIAAAIPELAGTTFQSINFTFLGINLGQIPNWHFWVSGFWTWATVGGALIPMLSAGSNVLSMWVGQKLNARVATDKDGNVDEAAARATQSTGKAMLFMMPAMTLIFGFMYPTALSLYWLAQGLFGIAQDAFLTVHYRKKYYDAEDAVKRRLAAMRAEEEAEKERRRAKNREENPDGIMENTSKKKLQNKQQVAREQSIAAARRAAAAEAGEDLPLSGDPERPFCKGRAYKADRYGKTEE